MSYYSYGNRIYSINEAKEEKGKDIHIIAALKAEIKKTKSPMEKKKLQAKLMKYTEKAMNEAKDLEDGLDDETIEKYRHLWNERNKKVCPHCGQPYKEQEAKLKAGLTSPSKDTMEDMTDSL